VRSIVISPAASSNLARRRTVSAEILSLAAIRLTGTTYFVSLSMLFSQFTNAAILHFVVP